MPVCAPHSPQRRPRGAAGRGAAVAAAGGGCPRDPGCSCLGGARGAAASSAPAASSSSFSSSLARRPPLRPAAPGPSRGAEPPPSPHRASVGPGMGGWGGLGGVREVGGGSRRDKGSGGAEDNRGTDLPPHRSAPRTMPRHRGARGVPGPPPTRAASTAGPPISPSASVCCGGVVPRPEAPPALQSPLPCPGPEGTRGVPKRRSRITGVRDPQTHCPRALPAPTWALSAGGYLPCPWHPGALEGTRGKSWTHSHE